MSTMGFRTLTGPQFDTNRDDRLRRIEAHLDAMTEQLALAQDRIIKLEQIVPRLDDAVGGLSELSRVVDFDDAGDLMLVGVNLRVVNGLGFTHLGNGKGNILIGYGTSGMNTSGSHNLVIGDGHTVSSHSGLVSGRANHINGPHAAAIGAVGCEVSNGAVAIGGVYNEAQARQSVVIGGRNNWAMGVESILIGGTHTEANDPRSVVIGEAAAEPSDDTMR
jgi:hypothetical protein